MTDRYSLRPVEPRAVGHPSPSPIDLGPIPDGEPALLEYWRILKKRRAVVAGFLAFAVAAVGLFALFAPTVYTAEAVILIEPDAPQVLDIPQVLSSTRNEKNYYETQYEILGGRALAGEIVEKLSLGVSEEGPGLFARFKQAIGFDPTPPEQIREQRIDAYLGALSIQPSRDTRLVRLGFTHEDPVLAAEVINAHADAYIDQGLELKTRASREAQALLEQRLGELKERVTESQRELGEYRSRHRIVSVSDRANVVVERLADLNERLTEAETRRVTLEADYELSQRYAAESLPAVLDSPLVNTLKESLAKLEAEQAFLATRFAPGYPRLAQVRAQVAASRRRLQDEVDTIVKGIESSYLAAQSTENELRARLEEQKTSALELNDASVELAMLQVEADTNRQLYDNVRARIKETGMAADLRASNVVVVEPAATPFAPAGPGKKLLLGGALFLGLLGGAGPRPADRVPRPSHPHAGRARTPARPPEPRRSARSPRDRAAGRSSPARERRRAACRSREHGDGTR